MPNKIVYNCSTGLTSIEEIEKKPARIYSEDYIRAKRNSLLVETDWMAALDYTMSDSWKVYRQELRDVPSQDGFPQNVIWPTKPE